MGILGAIGLIGMCIGIPLATFGAVRDWRAGKFTPAQRRVIAVAGAVVYVSFALLAISLLTGGA